MKIEEYTYVNSCSIIIVIVFSFFQDMNNIMLNLADYILPLAIILTSYTIKKKYNFAGPESKRSFGLVCLVAISKLIQGIFLIQR